MSPCRMGGTSGSTRRGTLNVDLAALVRAAAALPDAQLTAAEQRAVLATAPGW